MSRKQGKVVCINIFVSLESTERKTKFNERYASAITSIENMPVQEM